MKDGCRKPSFEQFGIGAIIAARGDQPAAYLRACVACSWKTSWGAVLQGQQLLKTSTPVPPAGFSLSCARRWLTASAIHCNS